MALYTIQAEDDLNDIASRFGTTATELAALNGIADPNKIQAGQVLNIPDPQPTVSAPIAAPTQSNDFTGAGGNNGANSTTSPVTPSAPASSSLNFNSSVIPPNGFSNPNGYNFSDISAAPIDNIPSGATQSSPFAGVAGASIPISVPQANPVVPAPVVGNSNGLTIPPANTSAGTTTQTNLATTVAQSHSVGTPTMTGGSTASTTGTNGAPLTVTGYQTNPDGSTTEYMSDGTSQTVNYSMQNGQLVPTSVTPSSQNGADALQENIPSNPNASALDYLKSLIGIQGTQGAVSEQAYENAGIYDKMQQVNDINNAMLANNRSYDEQIKAIEDKNPQGTFGGAAEQIALLQRQQLEDQANYAIVLNAQNNDLTTAQNIVNQKLQFQFAPIAAQIQSLGQFMSENLNDLSTSQQTQLENQKFALEQNYSQLLTAKQQAHAYALQNGISDPSILGAIDDATTPSAAYQAVQGMGAGGTNQPNGFNVSNSTAPMKLIDGSTVNPQVAQQVQQLSPTIQGYVQGGYNGIAWINDDRVPAGQKGQAQSEAAAAGIPYLTGNEVQGAQSIDVTMTNLNKMQQLAQVALGSGLIGSIGDKTIGQLANALQTGYDVTDPLTGKPTPIGVELGQFNEYRDAAIKAVTALAGGAGSGLRLNSDTIETAAQNLPNSTDNLEGAMAKIATFQSLLQSQLQETFPNLNLSVNQPTSTQGTPSSTGTPLAGINNSGQYAFGNFFGS